MEEAFAYLMNELKAAQAECGALRLRLQAAEAAAGVRADAAVLLERAERAERKNIALEGIQEQLHATKVELRHARASAEEAWELARQQLSPPPSLHSTLTTFLEDPQTDGDSF